MGVRRRAGWVWIARELAARPARHTLRVRKRLIDHPVLSGAVRSTGLDVGQIAHWRFPPDEHGRGLHVHEYANEWRVHLDRVHPARSLLGHFLADVL